MLFLQLYYTILVHYDCLRLQFLNIQRMILPAQDLVYTKP